MNVPKFILKVGTAAAMAVAFSSAHAVPITPVFTVAPGAGEQGSLGNFQANNISADYNELLTFVTASNFLVSIQFAANSFSLKDTGGNTNYNASQTGLGLNYGLYGLFTGQGTYAFDPMTLKTTFTLTPGGAFSLFFDKNNNTTFTQPLTAASAYGTVNTADDIVFANGVATKGTGFTGSGPNLTGAFGQETTVGLTGPGQLFFPLPSPFYNLSAQSGQFEGFPVTVGATVGNTGTLNIVFKVPEPGSLALVGVALVGLAFAAKRRKSV